MSDGLHRVAGATPDIEVAGKTYRTTPYTLGGRAEIEAHLLSKRTDVFVEAANRLGGIPEKLHGKVLDAAMRYMERGNYVTDDEVSDFIATFEGCAFLFWQAVREHQPEVDSLATAKAIAEKTTLGELMKELARVVGRYDVGGFDGPQAKSAAIAGQEQEPAAHPGQPSTDNSQSFTDGSQPELTS
jgi:hypothetical protein